MRPAEARRIAKAFLSLNEEQYAHVHIILPADAKAAALAMRALGKAGFDLQRTDGRVEATLRTEVGLLDA